MFVPASSLSQSSASTYAPTYAPKCPEYKARTNFIRLMAMSAKHYKMNWYIAGSFIRHIIAGNTNIKNTSMTLFLTPINDYSRHNNTVLTGLQRVIGNVTSMMNELEIMGMKLSNNSTPMISKGPSGLEPSHISVVFEAEMFVADAGMVKFPVIIKAFDKEGSLLDESLHPFSTDTIVLGASSLHVIKRSKALDGVNQYAGISLLERMIKVQTEKSIVQLNGFSMAASSSNWTALTTNASLLHSLKQIKAEGLNIVGNTIEINTTCEEGLCPICLECNELFVPLECTHSFCLSCLAEHLLKSVSGAECPMCRSQIIPCLKTATM